DSGSWIEYSGAFTLSGYGEGLHTIEYYCVDNVGHVESTNSEDIYLDITASLTIIQYLIASEPNIINTMTKFSLSSSDGSGSGVNSINYRIDDGTWNLYTAIFNLNGYTEGNHTIEYYSVDNVENIEKIKNVTVFLEGLETSIPRTIGNGDDDEAEGDVIFLYSPMGLITIGSIISAGVIGAILFLIKKRKGAMRLKNKKIIKK
ncbi:MAG: OmpL47-type beta-barrel domain-containing protein, partial [Promethearchaeota archaeon]